MMNEEDGLDEEEMKQFYVLRLNILIHALIFSHKEKGEKLTRETLNKLISDKCVEEDNRVIGNRNKETHLPNWNMLKMVLAATLQDALKILDDN